MWWAVADNRDPWGSLWTTASKQGYRNLGVTYAHPCDILSSLATLSDHSLRWARGSVDFAAPHLNSHSDGSVTLNSSVSAIAKCLNPPHESRAHIPQSVHICIQDSLYTDRPELTPPTSINHLSRKCTTGPSGRGIFLNWIFLFPNDSGLCEVDIKPDSPVFHFQFSCLLYRWKLKGRVQRSDRWKWAQKRNRIPTAWREGWWVFTEDLKSNGRGEIRFILWWKNMLEINSNG